MALKGIRVIEMAGLVPAPFCGMILSDFGANVICVDGANLEMGYPTLTRGKRSIYLNLKHEDGRSIIQKMVQNADVLIEPFRKGVMERLHLGPEILMKQNPRLIYARLTGYGQNGCLAAKAGHDINYLAIAGVLSTLGRKNENPMPPVNVLADLAGGGLLCAFGICLALIERSNSGLGQVIDSSMVEGAAYIANWLWRSRILSFLWSNERGANPLDTGSHFYQTYQTKDGKYMAVGSIEPQFYARLLKALELTEEEVPQFHDWEKGKEILSSVFATKTREEWVKIFEDFDACVTPVLDMDEAPLHPHNKARHSFLQAPDGSYEPAPAPVLNRTPAKVDFNVPLVGQHTVEILRELGYTSASIETFLRDKVVKSAEGGSKL